MFDGGEGGERNWGQGQYLYTKSAVKGVMAFNRYPASTVTNECPSSPKNGHPRTCLKKERLDEHSTHSRPVSTRVAYLGG